MYAVWNYGTKSIIFSPAYKDSTLVSMSTAHLQKMASSRYAFVLLLFSATTQLFLFGECADVKTIKKAFPFDGFAFDVTVNTKACGEAVEDLKYNSSIANYDQIMSFKLKRLSEKGGWLKIHPGVYPLTRPISIPSRVCFTGTNSSEVVLQARIPPMKGSSAIRLKGVTRVSVAHITLINNATNSIHVSDSTYTYFNSVSAAGAAGSNRTCRYISIIFRSF